MEEIKEEDILKKIYKEAENNNILSRPFNPNDYVGSRPVQAGNSTILSEIIKKK